MVFDSGARGLQPTQESEISGARYSDHHWGPGDVEMVVRDREDQSGSHRSRPGRVVDCHDLSTSSLASGIGWSSLRP